jgi:hypothetical protein
MSTLLMEFNKTIFRGQISWNFFDKFLEPFLFPFHISGIKLFIEFSKKHE